jgi:hypothetical protein
LIQHGFIPKLKPSLAIAVVLQWKLEPMLLILRRKWKKKKKWRKSKHKQNKNSEKLIQRGFILKLKPSLAIAVVLQWKLEPVLLILKRKWNKKKKWRK